MILTQGVAIVKNLVTKEEIVGLAKKLAFGFLNNRCLIGKPLGNHIHSGFFLPDSIRQTHMHVLGHSGSGKSRMLEMMIRQDIKRGASVCVIDPHGELFWNLVRYIIRHCDASALNRIYIIDPSNREYLINFNPFYFSGGSIQVALDKILSFLEKVWGSAITEFPGIRDAIKYLFYPALMKNLSIMQIKELFFNEEYRQEFFDSFISVAPEIPKDVYYYWEDLQRPSKSPKDIHKVLKGAHTRIDFILNSTALQLMSLKSRSFDISEAINNKGIILVNLAVSDEFSIHNQQLLGTVLLSEIVSFFSVRSRFFIGSGDRRARSEFQPCFLYIDEFQNFITKDVGNILAAGRKFGLHVILANQSFSQIPPELMDQVNNISSTKAYFSVKDMNTAIEIWRQTGRYTPQIKEIVTKFSSLPDGYDTVYDTSYSENATGRGTTTRSERHINKSRIIENEEKTYYTPQELDLIEGKKIQNLGKRKFLLYTEGIEEAVILETEWCFDIECSIKEIKDFYDRLYHTRPDIYSLFAELNDELKRTKYRTVPIDPTNSEFKKKSFRKVEEEDDQDNENPFAKV